MNKTHGRSAKTKAGGAAAAAGAGRSLRAHAIISTAALITAFAVILCGVSLSGALLRTLEERLAPLIGQGAAAAQRGDLAGASIQSARIGSEVEAIGPALMLTVNHRDIWELKRLAGEACLLGSHGGREAYLAAFNGMAALLEMLTANDRVSLGNLL